MVKKIIFDVDGTLLDTNKDCIDTYNEYFKSKSVSHPDDYSIKLLKVIDNFDNETKDYNKTDLIKYINNHMNINIDIKEFKEIFKIYQNHATLISNDIVSTLEYLSKKYELVALSKWYVEDQEKRLEKAGIAKYFVKIYGVENAGLKPSKEAFITVCKNHKPSECLMVGDSMKSDIGGARQAGLQAILLDPNDKYKYKRKIKNINELKNIL